jgi:hypothetical protein
MKHFVLCSATLLGLVVTANAQFLNGDFNTIGMNGNPVTSVGPTTQTLPLVESAAAHWYQFCPTPGGVITTQVLPSTQGSGNSMMLVTMTTGFYTDYGSGVGQIFGYSSSASFSCYLFVETGSITAGLVSVNGPFFDFTSYSYSGSWVHISQSVNSPTQSVGFENLGGGGASFYIADAQLQTQAVPEPASMSLLAFGALALARRKLFLKKP